MGIIENVLAKMQTTPQFRPMSADTFSDWSIEAGDIITVEVDGNEETLPVFSADMEWGGVARSTLSCTGNRERPTLSKAERQSYAAFGGVSRKIQETNEKILEDRKELIAALNNEDGAPEDLASGFQSYVRYDLENSEAYAESALFAQVGEKAKAVIGAYIVTDKDGNKKSLAAILADVIKLQGDTEILGNLSVDGGKLKVSKSIVTDGAVDCGSLEIGANKATFGNNDLIVQTEVALSANAMRLGTTTYKPTPITSTSGTVLVLGIA